MRVLSPGKVVLSGAYSVLEGAPAIVAAVDRYVIVDPRLRGTLHTDEVRAAGIDEPYWFDASALRHGDRKLGLGSSAAILVATLAAHRLAQCPELSRAALREWVYPRALEAHRLAQGGGSGVDVAAACHGGILEFQRAAPIPKHRDLAPVPSLHIEVWAASSAASTANMIGAVRRLAESAPAIHRRALRAQGLAAEQTLQAWLRNDLMAAITGFAAQRHALEQLGIEAQIPIVTPEVRRLADLAERHSAAVLPAGAGGGDIALYVGKIPADFLREEFARAHHTGLSIKLGAMGVHAEDGRANHADTEMNPS